MLTPDRQYRDLVANILDRGTRLRTRNSDCLRLFGLRIELNSFPLVWVRKAAWKTCLREMEWFMSGSSYLSDLHPSVRAWWEPWENSKGQVPYNYSEQLRTACGANAKRDRMVVVDQVDYLWDSIRDHPNSRRSVITTWNTAEMTQPDCPITNCHLTILQAFVDSDNRLHFVTYQRSADVICGLPHNWVQVWALLLYFANHCGRKPGSVIWMGGDIHVYAAHEELAWRMVACPATDDTVDLVYTPTSTEFRADDFTLSGDYKPLLTDKAEMVV